MVSIEGLADTIVSPDLLAKASKKSCISCRSGSAMMCVGVYGVEVSSELNDVGVWNKG